MISELDSSLGSDSRMIQESFFAQSKMEKRQITKDGLIAADAPTWFVYVWVYCTL